MNTSTTCIINAASARAEAARAVIARISSELGAPSRVIVTRGEELVISAKRAVADGYSRVAAGGGDGTVNAVAGALVGTDAAMGVLPIGTLNHFAKDVGIPLRLEDAVRTLFSGLVITVDVGQVNSRVFVNNSGTGVYPHLVREREQQQRRGIPKVLAFVRAVGSVLRRYTRLRVKLHVSEAEALAQVTPFLFVGNNRYEISGLEIGRRSSLSSGRLWVCMPPRIGRVHLLGMALRTLTGRVGADELNSFETEEIWVEPRTPSVRVSTDGEVSLMTAPLHYRIRPAALHVVVPTEQSAGSTRARLDT